MTSATYHGPHAPLNSLFCMFIDVFINIFDTYHMQPRHAFSSYSESTQAPRNQLERPARSQYMSGGHTNSSGSQPGYVYGDSVTSNSATPNQPHISPGPITQPRHDYTAPQPVSRRPRYPCQQLNQYSQSEVTLGSTACHGSWMDAAAADWSIWSNQRPPTRGALKSGCSATYQAYMP